MYFISQCVTYIIFYVNVFLPTVCPTSLPQKKTTLRAVNGKHISKRPLSMTLTYMKAKRLFTLIMLPNYTYTLYISFFLSFFDPTPFTIFHLETSTFKMFILAWNHTLQFKCKKYLELF